MLFASRREEEIAAE